MFEHRPPLPYALRRSGVGRALSGLAVLAASIGLTAPIASAAAEYQTTKADKNYCDAFKPVGLPLHRGDFSFGQLETICRPGYALSYNSKTKNADWVVEKLLLKNLEKTANRKKSKFKTDPAVTSERPAKLCDYKNSGFDRGHQAPSADFPYSQTIMNDSFFLTNMAPQVGLYFNRGIWSQLEETVRDIVRSRKILFIITGPVYDAPELEGPSVKFTQGDCKDVVAAPDGFYKILYDPQRKRALGFLLPNKKLKGRKVEEFREPIRNIEEMTGLNFFPDMPRRRQNILEINEGEMWRW